MRKPKKGKSLAELHPNLIEEWHSTMNGDLTPFDVSCGSNRKVFWKCDKADDHVWEARINKRSIGRGCPVCAGYKVVKSNCLATTHPDISKQWHLTRNKDLTPFDVVAGSNKKVWWKCPKADDHEWEAAVNNRTNGQNCGICAGRKIVKSTCLATTHPELVKEWHPTKNIDISPNHVSKGSGLKVWWKCPKGDDHEWISRIDGRVGGNGCPICSRRKAVKSNCLETTHPELAKQWHPTLNGKLTPKDVLVGNNKKAWWKCPEGDDHEWQAVINSRRGSVGCPVCVGQKVVKSNCLDTTHPEIAKDWHPTKNSKLTPYDFSSGSSKKVWWKCEKGDDHIYQQPIYTKVTFGGCPVCSGYKVVKSNSLSTLEPELAKQWHPTKNGKLTPSDVTIGSGKKVWWKCPEADDHEWIISISNRLYNACPMCSGNKVVKSNCLDTTHPELAKQWHPKKNGKLTPNDVISGSGKKIWWKCPKGEDHEWNSVVYSRTSGVGCPYCDLTPQSKQELTITFELMQFFKDINPKGFKTRVKGKLWSVDIYIPQLNLGIEFDGAYWHKDKRALDKLKTKQLKKEGFDIIRVRQLPLKKIFRTDILSKKPFNGKEVANKVLKQIMKMYDLDDRKVRKIENYLDKKELQNEKGLDKYIDMILTEKAEKNK